MSSSRLAAASCCRSAKTALASLAASSNTTKSNERFCVNSASLRRFSSMTSRAFRVLSPLLTEPMVQPDLLRLNTCAMDSARCSCVGQLSEKAPLLSTSVKILRTLLVENVGWAISATGRSNCKASRIFIRVIVTSNSEAACHYSPSLKRRTFSWRCFLPCTAPVVTCWSDTFSTGSSAWPRMRETNFTSPVVISDKNTFWMGVSRFS